MRSSDRGKQGSRIERLLSQAMRAFAARPGADSLLVRSPEETVASFAVRARAPYTVAVGTEADQSMVSEWAEQIEAAAAGVAACRLSAPGVPHRSSHTRRTTAGPVSAGPDSEGGVEHRRDPPQRQAGERVLRAEAGRDCGSALTAFECNDLRALPRATRGGPDVSRPVDAPGEAAPGAVRRGVALSAR